MDRTGMGGPLGGAGKTVEADETELAKSRKTKRPEGHRRRDNPVVVSLVERGGRQRSLVLDDRGVMNVVRRNVHPDSRLVTDKRSTTSLLRSRCTRALTTPSLSGFATTCTRTTWKASFLS